MLRILMILSLICHLDLLSARPAEEPTKFTLNNIENNSENEVHSRFEEAKELLGSFVDAIRIGRGRFVNSLILTRNIIVNKAEQLINDGQNNLDSTLINSDKSNQSRRSVIPVQTTTPLNLVLPESKETARLENETAQRILERRKPENVRQILDSFLTPKPIVDRIKEEEKYGNMGDKYSGFGKAIVDSYENLSNFINLIINIPTNAVRTTSRGITHALDQLGARIIGLQ